MLTLRSMTLMFQYPAPSSQLPLNVYLHFHGIFTLAYMFMNSSRSSSFCFCNWVNCLTGRGLYFFCSLKWILWPYRESIIPLRGTSTHPLELAGLTTSQVLHMLKSAMIRSMTAISTTATVRGSNFLYLCQFLCRKTAVLVKYFFLVMCNLHLY